MKPAMQRDAVGDSPSAKLATAVVNVGLPPRWADSGRDVCRRSGLEPRQIGGTAKQLGQPPGTRPFSKRALRRLAGCRSAAVPRGDAGRGAQRLDPIAGSRRGNATLLRRVNLGELGKFFRIGAVCNAASPVGVLFAALRAAVPLWRATGGRDIERRVGGKSKAQTRWSRMVVFVGTSGHRARSWSARLALGGAPQPIVVRQKMTSVGRACWSARATRQRRLRS